MKCLGVIVVSDWMTDDVLLSLSKDFQSHIILSHRYYQHNPSDSFRTTTTRTLLFMKTSFRRYCTMIENEEIYGYTSTYSEKEPNSSVIYYKSLNNFKNVIEIFFKNFMRELYLFNL